MEFTGFSFTVVLVPVHATFFRNGFGERQGPCGQGLL